jgi:Fe2+ or Zn2+ uptake regulation protein
MFNVSPKRNTIQRQIVLETLKRFQTHPTVDEVYAVIKEKHPTISKSTVYRNLRQLAESGEIRQVSFSDGLERYDGGSIEHYHFRCKKCGLIFDIHIEYLVGINEIAEQKYGFKIDSHDIVFTGVCQHCLEGLEVL